MVSKATAMKERYVSHKNNGRRWLPFRQVSENDAYKNQATEIRGPPLARALPGTRHPTHPKRCQNCTLPRNNSAFHADVCKGFWQPNDLPIPKVLSVNRWRLYRRRPGNFSLLLYPNRASYCRECCGCSQKSGGTRMPRLCLLLGKRIF